MIDLKFQKKQIDAYYFKFKKTVTYLKFLRKIDFLTFLFNYYMVTTYDTVLIEKESIPELNFPSKPLNKSKEQLILLKKKLKRSMILGNVHRTKMRIIFEDEEGVKEVQTTIWAAGDKNIVLKKGVTIPIHRLIDVIL